VFTIPIGNSGRPPLDRGPTAQRPDEPRALPGRRGLPQARRHEPEPVLDTDDIKASYDELSAKGVDFPTPPEFAAWGKWWATFKDTEGNEFGLGQDG
jgi:hypothetical protein